MYTVIVNLLKSFIQFHTVCTYPELVLELGSVQVQILSKCFIL